MTITHYEGSRGLVEIATMPLPYASNALAKLQREAPFRVAEIEALSAHVARLSEESAERQLNTPEPEAAMSSEFDGISLEPVDNFAADIAL